MHTFTPPKKPAKKDWHVADIKAALEKSGWSLRLLSIQHGFSAGSIRIALRRSWPTAEQIIAAAIGVKPETIWPSRYADTAVRRRSSFGSVRPKMRRAYKDTLNDTTHATACNVKEAEVV